MGFAKLPTCYCFGLVILWVCLMLPWPCQAVEEKTLEQQQSQVAVEDLIQVLNQQTDIATHTRLNIDFVPGNVTVLQAKEVQARGIRNVGEALKLVPGIATTLSLSLDTIVNRGIGENKLMIDNVPINAAIGSGNGDVTNVLVNMPIEQVERIEVIRGPGSALYGEYAFNGVINVVTRKAGREVFASYGGFNTATAGTVLAADIPQTPASLYLNAAVVKSDGGDVDAGEDALYFDGQGDISYAPGPSNEIVENRSITGGVDYKGFSLNGYYLENRNGDRFGIEYVLPPPEDKLRVTQRIGTLEAQQDLEWATHWRTQLNLQYYQYEFETDSVVLFPPGAQFQGPLGLTLTYPDGIVGDSLYKERRVTGGFETLYDGIRKHDLLLGARYSAIDVPMVTQASNVDPGTGLPLPGKQPTNDQTFIPEGLERNILGIYVQDQFALNDRFTLTAGLRYDHYDDVGSRFTPRLAASYHLGEHHILKIQYAEAFRPPSFIELYTQNNPLYIGNPNLDPEEIQTLDLGYIYSAARTVMRLSAFYSQVDNFIVTLPEGYPTNVGRTDLKGAELELIQQLSPYLKLDGNLAYLDAEPSSGTRSDLAGVANWIANAGLIFQPLSAFSAALQYRWVGPYTRGAEDTRNDLAAHQTLDVTATLFNQPLAGLTLRAGIKNLFDADVMLPALPLTYADDYPRPGRRWWLQASFEF